MDSALVPLGLGLLAYCVASVVVAFGFCIFARTLGPETTGCEAAASRLGAPVARAVDLRRVQHGSLYRRSADRLRRTARAGWHHASGRIPRGLGRRRAPITSGPGASR